MMISLPPGFRTLKTSRRSVGKAGHQKCVSTAVMTSKAPSENGSPTRGLDYALANHLYHLVKAAGFLEPDIEIHQPAVARGEDRFLLKWSVEEAGPAFIAAGLLNAAELNSILAEMDRDTRNLDILALMPRMSLVWARKPN
jgi:hypothetical protein